MFVFLTTCLTTTIFSHKTKRFKRAPRFLGQTRVTKIGIQLRPYQMGNAFGEHCHKVSYTVTIALTTYTACLSTRFSTKSKHKTALTTFIYDNFRKPLTDCSTLYFAGRAVFSD